MATKKLGLHWIAEAVEKEREARGWSAKILADRTGKHETTMHPVRKGTAAATSDTYSAIDRAFGWPEGTTEDVGKGTPVPKQTYEERLAHVEKEVSEISKRISRLTQGDL